MAKLKIYLLVLFCSFIFFTNGQDSIRLKLNLSHKIEGNFSKFYVDKLGNIFTLNSNQSKIVQYNSDGDSVFVFDNQMRFGNITSLDVSNPLKRIVYYKNYAQVVFLDRFFNVINTIDLRKSGILQASLVATSYDNNLWVYDLQSATINKVDAQGKLIFRSNDLRTVFNDALRPTYIKDENGILFLYDKTLGWLLFDYYGSFKKRLEYKNWENVFETNGLLFGKMNQHLLSISLKDTEPKRVLLSTYLNASNMAYILLETGKWYVLTNTCIDVYGQN